MLARSSSIEHPNGAKLTTPLLVPSFSSRGFGKGPKGKALVRSYFVLMKEFLTESYLISTFDLHHGILPRPRSASTELVLVDSGGYEAGTVDDLSAYTEIGAAAQQWTIEHHQGVLTTWPARIPAIFVSFDRYGKPANQLREALKQKMAFPHQLHAFLWKPIRRGKGLEIESLQPHAPQVGQFALLGVTEKELGETMPERLGSLAELRRMLDAEGIQTPIHVFGGLDPLSVSLYFLAGAEVFDGLTWLRFGFRQGLAVYRENCHAMSGGRNAYESLRAKLIADNYFALTQLEQAMRSYVSNRDLDTITMFPEIARRELAAIGIVDV